ncbi:MAG: exonuclease SbcCD subunit D C-terminal domain-containing protein [Verrucomicrobiota bacterium]
MPTPPGHDPQTVPLKPDGACRVLHTADWHLGKRLGDLSREEEHRRFLQFLRRAIEEGQVDVLMIAGDIFDSASPPQSSLTLYYDFISDLHRLGKCSTIVVAGNHDSPAHLEAPRRVLEALRVRVVGRWPSDPREALFPLPTVEAPRVVVAAVPFLRDQDLRSGRSGQTPEEIRQELREGIAKRYDEVARACRPWLKKKLPLIATGHLTLSDAAPSDSEREIHIGGLGAVEANIFSRHFHYVALGHLHRPQPGSKDHVRYSGSPIPLSFSEAEDEKEVRILDFKDGRLFRNRPLQIPPYRRLVQWRSERAGLEWKLKDLKLAESELPTWVEVVVDDLAPGENLFELVQRYTEGKPFEVIRVVGNRTTPSRGLHTGADERKETIEELLGDPKRVFGHRLDREETLLEKDRKALGVAFEELVSLFEDREREARSGE